MKDKIRVLHKYGISNIFMTVAGFPQWWPGSEPKSGHVEFVVDKTVSPANHSTQLLHNHHIHHPGLVQ
jgi:hypothetical protein